MKTNLVNTKLMTSDEIRRELVMIDNVLCEENISSKQCKELWRRQDELENELKVVRGEQE